MSVWLTAAAGLAILAFAYIRTFCPYFSDDCAYMLRSLKLGIRLTKYAKSKPFYSILECFLDAVKRQPNKIFIHFEGRAFSYGEMDLQSNKVARALQAEARLKEGDTVALFLPNEPSFVWTWLGLAKLGCPAALLNFNIRSKSLLHCFSCCGAKVLIASGSDKLLSHLLNDQSPKIRHW
uniref:Long-chain-fatty-acid--CoA ligase n=2 Tax=Poecilia latipinna TaxID=48699 RepID=A0A3B3UZ42_9TELE